MVRNTEPINYRFFFWLCEISVISNTLESFNTVFVDRCQDGKMASEGEGSYKETSSHKIR